MALVFENNTAGPKTHVFIIGVGGYPFLSGGAQEPAQLNSQVQMLGQLTSPPRSALAFRDFILELEQGNDMQLAQPLGSIELLVSPSPSEPDAGSPGEAFEESTFANITQRYNEWRARCDQDPNNVAVFFFSGHGVEKNDHYILPSDFGSNAVNPWINSICIDKTRRGFHQCAAQTQCFFIDSCRQITADMLQQNLPEIYLENPNFFAADCEHDLTVKAAAHNEKAFGPRKKPSYFTQAIIRALSGDAATKEAGQWTVNSSEISTKKITEILNFVKPDQGDKQRAKSQTGGGTTLVVHNGIPQSHLTITCNPEVANSEAVLSYLNIDTQVNDSRVQLSANPWELHVPAGIYVLSAQFNNANFNNGNESISVEPPSAKGKILVQ